MMARIYHHSALGPPAGVGSRVLVCYGSAEWKRSQRESITAAQSLCGTLAEKRH